MVAAKSLLGASQSQLRRRTCGVTLNSLEQLMMCLFPLRFDHLHSSRFGIAVSMLASNEILIGLQLVCFF